MVAIRYGLSKDFGISGYRLGALYVPPPLCKAFHNRASLTVRCCRYSRSADVVAAVSRVSVFTVPCHATQLALADVLSDVEFTREFLSASAAALRVAWSAVKQALHDCCIKFFEPSAGVFVWVHPATSASTRFAQPHPSASDFFAAFDIALHVR